MEVQAELGDYRFVAEHFGQLADAAARKPAAVTVECIGRSARGQPLWAFHVQEPGTAPVDRVLVLGGIHALEWISVEVAVGVLQDAIARPPRGTQLTVIPVLNIDGRLATEADMRAERERVYRRGNGATPPVDLNRDFAVHRTSPSAWRHVLPGLHASTAEGALSQPETQALDRLADRHRYDRAVSLHAFGGYHYFPWSGVWERPDDWHAFVALGRKMEAAQGRHAYRPRQLARWATFFRASGTEIDHLYGRYRTLAFLTELTRSGIRPLRWRRDLRSYFRWYNPKKLRKHVERGIAGVRALIRG